MLKRFICAAPGSFAWALRLWRRRQPQVLGIREKLPNDLVWLFSQQSRAAPGHPATDHQGRHLQEPTGKEGLANLTASLLFSGTKSRSLAKIAEELDFMGARLTAAGGDDFAAVSLTVLKKDLGPALELVKDILLNPTFSPAEVKRKVASLRRPWRAKRMSPWWWPSRAFAKDLYGDFPYGHPVHGHSPGAERHHPPGPGGVSPDILPAQ